jgi:mRNA interferase RelE/StbE
MSRFGGRMAHRLLYLPGVERDIRALPGRVAERVRHGLERLAEDPRLGKPLHGDLAPFWSYRVGDYRVVYEIRDKELVVLVVMLGHRRAIYERARRKRK